jgi:hypothetical protein
MDAAGLDDVAGTAAGDNTVFVAARDGLTGAKLADELRRHLGLCGAVHIQSAGRGYFQHDAARPRGDPDDARAGDGRARRRQLG